MNTQRKKDYVWMLKNKTTGKIYNTYTYKTRLSARKATKSESGRFKNYSPVKLSNSQAQKFIIKAKSCKKTTVACTGSSQTSSFNSSVWFPIAQARRITNG